jgi:hypothetical protein
VAVVGVVGPQVVALKTSANLAVPASPPSQLPAAAVVAVAAGAGGAVAVHDPHPHPLLLLLLPRPLHHLVCSHRHQTLPHLHQSALPQQQQPPLRL